MLSESWDFFSTPASLRGTRRNRRRVFTHFYFEKSPRLVMNPFPLFLSHWNLYFFQLQMVSSNTNSVEEVGSHLISFLRLVAVPSSNTLETCSRRQLLSYVFLIHRSLSLSLTFINCHFHPPETRTHDKDEKQSFVLISEGKSGGGRNFSARVQCQKVFICVFRDTTQPRESGSCPLLMIIWFLGLFSAFYQRSNCWAVKKRFFLRGCLAC